MCGLALFVLLLAQPLLNAFADDPQALVYAEYFWDTDPGLSNGVPVTVAAAETFVIGSPSAFVLNVSVTSLSAGLHRLGFRVVDASARWSDINWLPVQVQNAATLAASVATSSINDTNKLLVAAEYFWDSDPGNGNGTPVSVSAAESFTLGAPGANLFNVGVSSLAAGLHQLGFRTKDASATWSGINWLPVQVQNAATLAASVATSSINDTNKLLVAAEYFWDGDPGNGNGTPVSVPAGESFTLGAPGTSLFNVGVSSLAAGLHQLGFRAKDASANWSGVNWLPVQVQNAATLAASVGTSAINDTNKLLIAAEYFWDGDPGNGNGTPVSVPTGESFTLGVPGTNLFNVGVSSLPAGLHQLGFRAKDASANWSDINWLPVEVPGTPLVLLNGQYYSNNVVQTTNGASFQVTLQSAFPNATIFYTTDGSDPNGANLYSGPFTATAPFSIRAIAWSEDFYQFAEATVNSLSVTAPGGSVTFTSQVNSTNGVVSANLTAAPAAGWTFLNWSGDASGTNTNTTVVVDGPKSVQAVFGTSLTTSGAGLVEIQPVLALYPCGSTVRLTAVPTNSITYFRQWGGAANGQVLNPLDFVITTANPLVSAVFFALPANTHSLTVLINGDGDVTKTPQQSNYLNNASVTLTAKPGLGSFFVNWTGDTNSALNPLSVVMNANKTVTATFSTNVATPPSVTITNPVAGAVFTAPVNIPISASASTGSVALASVAIYGGTNLLSTISNAPYAFTWTNAPIGTNILTAIAVDSSSLSATSAPVSITVLPSTPQVALTSPTNGNAFTTPANILVRAIASDADNALARVEFYAQSSTNNSQPFLLSAVTNPPYNFTWSNVAIGTYTLTANAVDSYGPVVTSVPVSIIVSPPPSTNPPVFFFSSANYSVNESNGAVVVTVLNSGDLGGLVNYSTADGTAFGGSGYSGSYTIAQGSFLFANGQHSTNLTIGILDNYLDGPDIQFSVGLSKPGAGTLGVPATTTVAIHLNDIGGVTNSLLAVASPGARPPTSGSLTMVLTPPEAGGQWRFPWEQGWRQSGDTASGLEKGNYTVEFRNVPNYLADPAGSSPAVTDNVTTVVTNQYWPTYTSFDTNSTGSLTMNIGPNTPAGSGWRFIGESAWRANNTLISSLLPDTYFIEYEPVSGWAKPASQAEQVFGGQGTVVSANYLLASALPSGTSPPSPITPALITDIADYPYGFNGQLDTDTGYGSGVAVRENVVLTAAHMVFNDATLSYVNQAYWSFQGETGVFEPEPLPARGWYVLSGYAAQRTNDLPPVGNLGVDQSSLQSRNLDVAALYFSAPVARGGYGGYLTSDTVPSPWLTGSNLKMLVGYPVDGSQFGDASIVPGRMYTTPAQPQPTALTWSTNNVYTASWFLSYPGNSGGPLYAKFNGYYYPAAVYLGSVGSGQNSVSVVRAITSEVVNLINLAASLGDEGTNYTGGGVITITTGGGSGLLAYVQVPIEPAAAVAAGAAWRLSGTMGWSTSAIFTEAIAGGSSVRLEFKPIPGWNPPTNKTMQVTLGQLTTVPATYTPSNAQMGVTPAGSLVSSGYPGGPFSPPSIAYSLTNLSGSNMSWTVSVAAPWLSVSPSSGTLAGGASTNVQVSISANANGLAAGNYTDTVGFTNVSNGSGNTTRSASLNVVLPPGNLGVSPAAGLASSGYTGGPFSPVSISYGLTNAGGSNLSWTVSAVATWLSVSPSSGTLAGGASTNVQVSISANANGLAAGAYTDTVGFTNLSNGSGNTTRSASLSVVLPTGNLGVSPTAGLASSGYTGGPFSPSSISYALTNAGGSNLSWTVSAAATWLSVSPSSGTLAGGASTNVQVSISANANGLAPGAYTDTVGFTNLSSGLGNTSRLASLSVVLPPGNLGVSPAAGLASSGYAGGPFSPASISYALTNTGGSNLSWTVSAAATWLSVSPSSGTLAGGASTNVQVSISANANGLAPGNYTDTVGFTNVSNGSGNTTRSASLNVVLPSGNLGVSSAAGLASSGYTGGPFSPSSISYALTNAGGSNLSWTVSAAATWLSVSPSSGTLAGGASTNVQVSISANANGLAAGNYTDTVGFTNVSNGSGNTSRLASLSVVLPPGNLGVSPTAGLASSGYTGGPFSPSSISYGLTNAGGSNLSWTVSAVATWLSVSPSSGTLAGGASTNVQVSISVNANGLAAGSYTDTVGFTNLSSGLGNTNRPASLSVVLPPGNLGVSPAAGLASSGYTGGPFSPPSISYGLTNAGASSLSWTASATANWLSVSPGSGTLAGGASTNVQVSISVNANGLASGNYTDTVRFTNLSNGSGNTTRPASLSVVLTPAAPVLTFAPAFGLGITGTTGTTFRLEYRTSLVSGQWLPLKTNTLGPGLNLLLPWPPTNGPAAFYRAMWLP